jgi:hypothetical protein
MQVSLTKNLLLATLLGVVGCANTEFEDGDGGPPNTDAPYERPLCDAYDFRGAVYDCSALDRCSETDLEYRIACCECDPQYCNADPSCEPDPDEPPPVAEPGPAESCMSCHNGSERNDYAGPGMSNPHPFEGAQYTQCTTCHGGNGDGAGKLGSHVPPPPEIGDDAYRVLDQEAFFNRLTLAGIDKLPDYTVDGVTYTALQYLQFVNPGDLRVVTNGEGCGTPGCHAEEHVKWVSRHPFGNSTGIFSGATYSVGLENAVPEQDGLWEDTAADYAFRARTDPEWRGAEDEIGTVGEVLEWPERAQWGDRRGIYNNPLYDANDMTNQVYATGEAEANQIIDGTPLEHVYMEAVGFQCGDCHLGSAGANNRYGDFRSSGCTACHMEYSTDGRSRSTDPNVNHFEPFNPDAIAAPERSHIDAHQIRNVAKFLPGGAFLRGISDYACVGCHQGSNRTVLQFWGIRLDQNQDLENDQQYPTNPVTFQNTAADDRLYDPAVANTTFNGRVPEQYILTEDYDGDGRDDTPADVHHEAGLGCIDCHGSRDVHNGTRGDPTSGNIISRMDEGVAIECQSCHGGVGAYAATGPCETYEGDAADCAIDRRGNPVRHVTRDGDGNFWLVSRLNGSRHFVPQTRDTTVDTGRRNPLNGEYLYNPVASYAMGRADGNAATGIGPLQQDPDTVTLGFSHTDNLACQTCHSSWTNNCIGCHLKGQYDADPENYWFSNITGERISTFVPNADFTYITPVPFYLGVNARGQVTQTSPGIQTFFRYQDINGNESDVFAFSDRQGNGNNPGIGGRDDFGALSHDTMMAHSIRGRVEATNEGPRYCVSCHLNEDSLDAFGAEYDAFRTAMVENDFRSLDFALLAEHIGQNPGNQINSPLFVHMVAGLGSGLFLFDETGCPVNPLDNNANRQYCPDGAPADNFDPDNAVYNLDGLVEPNGISNVSSSHAATNRDGVRRLRGGSLNGYTSGPLGAELIQKLTDPNVGVVLDSYFDADGQAQGNAAVYIAR